MTKASELFTGKLLLERPEDMDFKLYKELVKLQNKTIKKLFKTKPMRRVANLMPVRLGYNLHF